ncbi:MAG TPA: hypothetical protein VFA48_02155 [Gammaproteobacteria bacterium]|nr:hypothetical protein [Gammaproteobacteria bacterium]
MSGQGIPDDLDRLISPDKMLLLPERDDYRPHPTFLRWHRENVFKR